MCSTHVHALCSFNIIRREVLGKGQQATPARHGSSMIIIHDEVCWACKHMQLVRWHEHAPGGADAAWMARSRPRILYKLTVPASPCNEMLLPLQKTA